VVLKQRSAFTFAVKQSKKRAVELLDRIYNSERYNSTKYFYLQQQSCENFKSIVMAPISKKKKIISFPWDTSVF